MLQDKPPVPISDKIFLGKHRRKGRGVVFLWAMLSSLINMVLLSFWTIDHLMWEYTVHGTATTLGACIARDDLRKGIIRIYKLSALSASLEKTGETESGIEIWSYPIERIESAMPFLAPAVAARYYVRGYNMAVRKSKENVTE